MVVVVGGWGVVVGMVVVGGRVWGGGFVCVCACV